MTWEETILEREKDIIVSFYQKQIEECKLKIEEAQKEIEFARTRIAELTYVPAKDKDEEGISIKGETKYSVGMPLWQKVEYILRLYEVYLTTREIANAINKFEGNHYSERDLKELVSKIGATLKPKIDNRETFVRYERGAGEFHYGLLEWIKEIVHHN